MTYTHKLGRRRASKQQAASAVKTVQFDRCDRVGDVDTWEDNFLLSQPSQVSETGRLRGDEWKFKMDFRAGET